MIFILCGYLALVYLVFFKLRWVPWNRLTGTATLLLGITIMVWFLVGLRTLTPSSSQAGITGVIVEIAPLVSGRVSSVSAQRNVIVEEGTELFSIDPTIYQATVDQLDAGLALSRLRLEQYEELAAADAGSRFALQQAQAETRQLEAQLASAQFNLENTTVRAPARGMVPRTFLKEGAEVSPGKSVLSFIDTSELMVAGLFPQKALQNVELGDTARINFPALPGRVFESRVAIIPPAIGDTQILTTGVLPKVSAQKTTRLYPIYVEIPEDYPEELRKVGLAAKIYIHTEGAGIVSPVAAIAQWISSSLDAIR